MEENIPDCIEIPIDGVLDLHTFHPKEVDALLYDYLEECRNRGILEVRIIHGKGKGILRRKVRSILKKHPLVTSIQEASVEFGAWGATIVQLRDG